MGVSLLCVKVCGCELVCVIALPHARWEGLRLPRKGLNANTAAGSRPELRVAELDTPERRRYVMSITQETSNNPTPPWDQGFPSCLDP